jgi:hypothetical protein
VSLSELVSWDYSAWQRFKEKGYKDTPPRNADEPK